MLDGEMNLVVLSAEVEGAVEPGVDLARTSQGLSRTSVMSLASVVNEEDGGLELSLQLSQVREKGGDFRDHVLIDAMGAHEGIEDEQARPQPIQGPAQPIPCRLEVDAQGRLGDDVHVEMIEGDAASPGDSLEPLAHDVERILSGEEKDRTGLPSRIALQAWGAGRHGHGEIESEERLEALGFAPDHPDGLVRPKSFDKPARLCGPGIQFAGTPDGELSHRRPLPERRAALSAGGRAKTSR
jgi:hypothetical protein